MPSFACTYAQGNETFYSTNLGGDNLWTNAANWALDPAGTIPAGNPPGITDNVVIRDSVRHNVNSGYIHYGDITIEESGIYSIFTTNLKTDPYFFAGERMEVFGLLRTSSDFEHQLPRRLSSSIQGTNDGTLTFFETAVLRIGDDLILNGEGFTVFDNFACGDGSTVDDLYVKGWGNGLSISGKGVFVVPDAIRVWDTDNPTSEVELSGQPYINTLEEQVAVGFVLLPQGAVTDCSALQPLPVELTHFGAEIDKEAVKLSWVTASETQNDHFLLEKANPSGDFDPLARLEGNGTTSAASYYEFIDMAPSIGRNLYRLKQVDIDGAFSYSNIVSASFQISTPGISVFPHPVQGSAQVDVIGFPISQQVTIRVENLLGQIIMEQLVEVDRSGAATLSVNSNLRAGTYLIKAHSQAVHLSRKFMVY
ncbi:MAG: hypothetical protein AAF655_05180 [Bacteroidota bacterium]